MNRYKFFIYVSCVLFFCACIQYKQYIHFSFLNQIKSKMATYYNGALNKSSEGETLRFTLRRAWSNINVKPSINTYKRAITPFRAVNNAGDYLARMNYSSGGPNQVNGVKQSIAGAWKTSAGRVRAQDDGTNIQAASCNPKYVYDSSNYIAFRKQQAVNKNYNDTSAGGDEHNASYTAIRRVRRF
jgi:hypothetical protein